MVGLLSPKYKKSHLEGYRSGRYFVPPKLVILAGRMLLPVKSVRTSKARLLRDNVIVFGGIFGSLKRFKDDVREVPRI